VCDFRDIPDGVYIFGEDRVYNVTGYRWIDAQGDKEMWNNLHEGLYHTYNATGTYQFYHGTGEERLMDKLDEDL